MSRENARTFLERLEHDPTLRKESAVVLEADATVEQVLAIASSHGLSFTASELTEAMRDRGPGSGTARSELTDADLEGVAGGMTDKRAMLFDMLRAIIDKYNETAKATIQTLGR
jgi:predicted ribosomally synthesized peptide with nif11-like leader